MLTFFIFAPSLGYGGLLTLFQSTGTLIFSYNCSITSASWRSLKWKTLIKSNVARFKCTLCHIKNNYHITTLYRLLLFQHQKEKKSKHFVVLRAGEMLASCLTSASCWIKSGFSTVISNRFREEFCYIKPQISHLSPLSTGTLSILPLNYDVLAKPGERQCSSSCTNTVAQADLNVLGSQGTNLHKIGENKQTVFTALKVNCESVKCWLSKP